MGFTPSFGMRWLRAYIAHGAYIMQTADPRLMIQAVSGLQKEIAHVRRAVNRVDANVAQVGSTVCGQGSVLDSAVQGLQIMARPHVAELDPVPVNTVPVVQEGGIGSQLAREHMNHLFAFGKLCSMLTVRSIIVYICNVEALRRITCSLNVCIWHAH